MSKKANIILPFLFLHFLVEAQNPGELKGFYGSINIGSGIVNGNISGTEIRTTLQFAMHFSVGYFINRSVQLGLTGNGWLFEPYQSTRTEENGESLSNSMIYIQVYPTYHCRLFVKGGYGISKYINNHPDKDNGKGYAFMAAAGFEHHLGKKEMLWGLQLSYQNGKLRYNGIFTPVNQLHRSFQVVDLTLFIGLD